MKSEDVDFWFIFIIATSVIFIFALSNYFNYNSESLILKTQINQGNNIKIVANFNSSLKRSKNAIYNLENTLEQLVFEKTISKNYNINKTKEVIREIIQKEIKKEEYDLDSKLKVINIEIFPVKSEKRI